MTSAQVTARHAPDEAIPAADDPKATAAFVGAHIGWMLAVARRYLGEAAAAEDAVQNAFAQIFSKADQYDGRSGLKAWMRRIVANEALMILRKTRALKEDGDIDPMQPDFDIAGCRIEAPWTPPADPEALAITSQTQALVRAAVAQLPESYRVIVMLRDIDGLSTREVAEATGLSEANVKVRLGRARAALKTQLEPDLRAGRLST